MSTKSSASILNCGIGERERVGPAKIRSAARSEIAYPTPATDGIPRERRRSNDSVPLVDTVGATREGVGSRRGNGSLPRSHLLSVQHRYRPRTIRTRKNSEFLR